jgi:hypothetical protein
MDLVLVHVFPDDEARIREAYDFEHGSDRIFRPVPWGGSDEQDIAAVLAQDVSGQANRTRLRRVLSRGIERTEPDPLATNLDEQP